MSVTDVDKAKAVSERLRDLAEALESRGFAARVLVTDGKLRMSVQHRTVAQLSEAVYAAPADDGSWWLWWSWADRLAPIEEVESAAVKIAYVLTPA